jgi:tetratricopeptide (TPR) repeat protein
MKAAPYLALPLAALLALGGCGDRPETLFARARAAFDAENYPQARNDLSSALDKRPGDRAMLALLVETQLRLGDPDAAERALARFERSGGSGPALARMRAQLALLRRDPGQVLELLGRDGSTDGWRIRAEAHLALGDDKAARAAFENGFRAHRRVPGDMRLLTAYARFLLLDGDLPQAARLLAAMKAVSAEAYPTLVMAGDLAISQGDRDTARNAYRQAVKRYPDQAAPMLALAFILREDGDLAGAQHLVGQVDAIEPGNPRAELLGFQIMADREEWASVRRDLLPREATLTPGSPLSTIYGETLLRLGQSEQARMLFTRAVLHMPGDPSLRTMLAEAQLATGDARRAWATIAPLAAGTLATPDILDCALRAARRVRAPEAAGLAARLAPAALKATLAAMREGEQALAGQDWQRAAAVYSRLLARGEDAQVLNRLASAEIGLERPALAIAHADRAVALDPQNAQYLYVAAMARVTSGRDLPMARRLLETAKAIDPGDPAIVQGIQQAKAAAS